MKNKEERKRSGEITNLPFVVNWVPLPIVVGYKFTQCGAYAPHWKPLFYTIYIVM